MTSTPTRLPAVCLKRSYCTALRTLLGPSIPVGTWELLPGLEHGAQRLQRYLPNRHLRSEGPSAAMLWETVLSTAQLPGSQAPLHIAVNSQVGLSHALLPRTLAQEMAILRSRILR